MAGRIQAGVLTSDQPWCGKVRTNWVAIEQCVGLFRVQFAIERHPQRLAVDAGGGKPEGVDTRGQGAGDVGHQGVADEQDVFRAARLQLPLGDAERGGIGLAVPVNLAAFFREGFGQAPAWPLARPQ